MVNMCYYEYYAVVCDISVSKDNQESALKCCMIYILHGRCFLFVFSPLEIFCYVTVVLYIIRWYHKPTKLFDGFLDIFNSIIGT